MKIQVERDVLADAVSWVARALPANPALPVLRGLRLVAADGSLEVSAFDFEVSARSTSPVSVGEAGEALVPGRLLADIVRTLPDHPVEVALAGPRVTVSCGSSRYTLPTLPLDEYPVAPQMPSVSGTVGADVFASAVGSVAVAAGRDDTLPVLTGVRMEIDGDVVTLAATDRYRLAVRRMTWQPAAEAPPAAVLVPARTLADTARTLSSGAQVTIALAAGGAGEGMIGFECGARRTTTRLLDGEFPKYRQLLPTESSAVAVAETGPLVESVKRIALVAARNSPVKLTFADGALQLEAEGQEDAQGVESLPVDYSGEQLTIAFNPGYLLDGLAAIDSDTARLAFTSPNRPALLTGKHDEGEPDYQHLLMPVRLPG